MHVFDIESLGVDFKNPDWVHNDEPKAITCICALDRETGTEYVWRYENVGEIEAGLRYLMDKDLGGHRIQGFDIPYIQAVYPWWRPTGVIRDSLVESEMWYPAKDLRSKDYAAEAKYGRNNWIPFHLYGRHSLEAWGARLKEPKDDFSKRMKALGLDPWGSLPEPYATERVTYCAQDVRTNTKVFDFLESKFDYEAAAMAVRIENRVAQILVRQEQWGVRFHRDRAIALHQELTVRQDELFKQLEDYFEPFYQRDGKGEMPKRTMKRFVENENGSKTRKYKGNVQVGWYEHITEGDMFVKVKLTQFNPNSRPQIADRLQRLYGWKPTEMTDTGIPKVDEKTLQDLRYPPIPMLIEYMLVQKRIGQVADGKNAWLRQERDGRIHGRVSQNGTRTTRASHNSPNLGQVPKVSKPYGPQCRACFGPSEGRQQVGVDLSGIELRGLGHYLARYDGGVYARNVIDGDVHEDARVACVFNERDNVKTLEYAFLYGAFDTKLGITVYDDMTPEQRKAFGKATRKSLTALGNKARSRLEKGINGLEPLVKAAHQAAKRKRMRALDGRMLAVPSKHSALNTILQSLGGVLSKVWMVIVDDALIEAGINPAHSWIADDTYGAVQMLYVHDELQFDTKPGCTEQVMSITEQSAINAGEQLQLRVVVNAKAQAGANWAECH